MATQRIANAYHAGSNPVRASNIKLRRRPQGRLFAFVIQQLKSHAMPAGAQNSFGFQVWQGGVRADQLVASRPFCAVRMAGFLQGSRRKGVGSTG